MQTLNSFLMKAPADPTNIPDMERGIVLNRAALIQVINVTLFKNMIIH